MKTPVTLGQLLAENSCIDHHTRRQWLLVCLNQPLGYLISHRDEPVSEEVLATYQEGIKKIAQGVPLPYVVGKQAFWRHDFLVNEHTLIPRPDSERLVETVLGIINHDKNSLSKEKLNQTKNLLDLGTGSGCLAISLALELPTWHVTAIDISPEALKIAQKNATTLGANNLTFMQGSWFKPLMDRQPQPRFDVIISNPPYIAPDDKHLEKLQAEPLKALVAADNGLADITSIIAHSRAFLKPQGLLALEHGYQQGRAVRERLAKAEFNQIQTVSDYGGNERVTFGFA